MALTKFPIQTISADVLLSDIASNVVAASSYATDANSSKVAAASSASDAADSASAAAEAADEITTLLPGVTTANARQMLRVKNDGSGYQLIPRKKICIFGYSQSNFARLGTINWTVPHNLFVFDGGVNGAIGTSFITPDSTTIRLPIAYAKRVAEEHPDADVYLLICATGGVSIRAVAGMNYYWSTGLSGDPGAGYIGFNNAAPGSVTQVRYSEIDNGAWTRFIGGTGLGDTSASLQPARIQSQVDLNVFVEFSAGTAVTDSGAYRSQTATVTASASWPPANGTPVTVYPATDPLRTIIAQNANRFFNTLGLSGADRVFDEVLLWPTEADVNYIDSYVGRDHGVLMTVLSTWTDAATQYTYTLPWPYSANSPVAIKTWWAGLRSIAAQDTTNRKIIDLRSTTATNWESVNDYVHVNTGADMMTVGKLIHAAGKRGGLTVPAYQTNTWSPAFGNTTNLDALPTVLSPTTSWYIQVGDVVHYQLYVNCDPTAAASTTFNFTLPIASNIKQVSDLVGDVANGAGTILGRVYGATSLDQATVTFVPISTVAQNIYIKGMYRVI